MPCPRSCDTFVALPPCTKNGAVIFGKNSDRPQNEVQEVVYIKRKNQDTTLKCTYISIEESSTPLNDVILSKPAWMWGAEMGANNKNVVIGNEAVWTNYNEGDGDASQPRLLGMDLVRLGLERGSTAEEALNIITSLLEKYGQGGPCSEHDDSHFYHNSFLIADPAVAWVLETSGKLWAAEKIVSGYRNISNGLTITTKIDKHSGGLKETAKTMGLWDGQSEFNFAKCFSSGGDSIRQLEGERLLKENGQGSTFDVADMFKILRHTDSGICRSCDDTFPTQGSQVSSLTKGINVHWFTATPDPSVSYFKPFIFTNNPQSSKDTESPNEPKREHRLYKLHKQRLRELTSDDRFIKSLQNMEDKSLKRISDFITKLESSEGKLEDMDNVLKQCVDEEISLYT